VGTLLGLTFGTHFCLSKGVSKANRGYKWGYKTLFNNQEPSIHAGYSVSIDSDNHVSHHPKNPVSPMRAGFFLVSRHCMGYHAIPSKGWYF
jgi:hypothetical protein